ncbi:YT521-B-like family protein [Apiospora saccharicola]
MDDYTRSQQQEQQRDLDLDLAHWLHMTGWHNVLGRNEKLEKWRDIHFDYETQRSYIMSDTWERLDQDHREAQMEYEMAGNQKSGSRDTLSSGRTGNAFYRRVFSLTTSIFNRFFLSKALPTTTRPWLSALLPATIAPSRRTPLSRPVPPRGVGSPAAAPGAQIRGRARERSYRSRSPVRARSPPPVRGHVRGRHGGGFGGGDNSGRPYNNNNNPQPVASVQRPITDIDLGDEGETRFFMIKSVDTRNIFTCWDDNLWATSSVEKGNILADAFDTSKNVILFFSANGPHDRPPSGNITKPEWYHLVSRDMSEPFPVEWLSKNVCPDRLVRNLVNCLNFDEEAGLFMPPNRSRDCQEIDGGCGRAMLEILNNFVSGNGNGAGGAGGAGGRPNN